MPTKFPGLKMVSSLLKTVSILFIVVGIGLSVWIIWKEYFADLSQVVAIGGIVLSIVVGLIMYGLSDLFQCIMDIEFNTRNKQLKP